MSTTGVIISCPEMQSYLSDTRYFTEFDPTENRYVDPFLATITSPENTSGILQSQIDVSGGRKRDVKVVFTPRFSLDDVEDDASQVCTATQEIDEFSKTYTIDSSVGSRITKKITLSNLEESCASDPYYVRKTVVNMIDALLRKMNIDSIGQAITLFGNHVSTGNANAVSVATKSGNTLLTDLATQLGYDKKLMRVPAGVNPFVIGGSQAFYEFFRGWTTANAGGGVTNFDLTNYVAQFGLQPVIDDEVDGAGAWGVNNFAMLIPGAIQLLTFNEFKGGERGIRVIDTENYKQGIITDPLTGIDFDFIQKFDCGEWHFILKVAHKLEGMPTNLFRAGDNLEGVTYFNRYVISN